jgi:hypothetical protein
MAEDGVSTVPTNCENGAAIVRTDKLRRQHMTNKWTVFIIFSIKIGYTFLSRQDFLDNGNV